jgi:hypothetical protein
MNLGPPLNNRTEEAIGTTHDLWTAYREGSFDEAPRPSVVWLMLVEDAPKPRSSVKERSIHFPVRPELQNASYIQRYDLLCKTLVQEQLYTTASIITSTQTAVKVADSKTSAT